MTRRTAQEEVASGHTQTERERTFYARIEDTSVLALSHDIEHHTQWEIRIPKTDTNPEGGRFRVRRTEPLNPPGPVEYVQTIKINRPENVPGRNLVDETSFAVTEDVFNQYKRLANAGMVKKRHCFTFGAENEQPGTRIEVDVFPMPEGKIANWVKIDYEYEEGAPDTPTFPTAFKDIIPGDTQDPEERDFISKLYREVFLTTPTSS